MKAPLTLADYQKGADTLGVPVAAIRAFAEVESRGSGFLPDDRPTILFERHVFRRELMTSGISVAELEKNRPDICNKTPGGYGNSTKEWQRLADAIELNRGCALASASWGGFQVMGFNWKRCQYSSVQDFVNAMFRSSADHLDSFVRYIRSDKRLLAALKAQDWPTCSLLYNGRDYLKNKYDTKLADAFAKYSKG